MKTKKILKNIAFDFIPLIFGIVFTFLRIKVYIEKIGLNLNGAIQFIFVIMGYVSIAEAGVINAATAKIYNYVSKKMYQETNAVISGLKQTMQRVSIIVLTISIIVSFFLKFIINDIDTLGLTKIYSIYFILIFRTFLNNYLFIPNLVSQANQDGYLFNLKVYPITIIRDFSEIALIWIGIDIRIVLIIVTIFMVIENRIRNYLLFKKYTWMHYTKDFDKAYLGDVKYLVPQKIAELIFHSIDLIVLNFTPNLGNSYISKYTTYKGFSTKINSVTGLLTSNNANALAISLSGNDPIEKKTRLFFESYVFNAFFGMITVCSLYMVMNDFLTQYIGKKILLQDTVVLAMCALLFMDIIRDTFISTAMRVGKFKETYKSAVLEPAINIILSFILVSKIGIIGLFISTIIAHLLTNIISFPKAIFDNVILNKNKLVKVYGYMFYWYVILFVNIKISMFIKTKFNLVSQNILGSMELAVFWGFYFVITTFLIFLTQKDFWIILNRIKNLISQKGKIWKK